MVWLASSFLKGKQSFRSDVQTTMIDIKLAINV